LQSICYESNSILLNPSLDLHHHQKAKNMPPDPQTLLQQPLWTTALQFIDSPHNSSNGTNQSSSFSNLLASGTAYKQIQIYDVRASSSTDSAQGVMRRPVLHTPENLLKHRVTSLLQLPNTNQLLVADAIGDCHILDMRKFHSGKQSTYKKQKQSHSSQEIGLGRLVGPGGSVRQLALHPTLPLVACVGLDRKLWTWDVNTKRMIDCIYLRQRLNCLLVCEDEGWNGGDENGAGDARLSSEIDGWEEEGDDLVQDYVDSDEENAGIEEETDSNETSGSSSDDTESESDEESGSSAEKNANTNEHSSEEEESDTPPPKQKQSNKSGHPKKKQKNY
jgi:ribosome biogenesis protein NSA1